MIDRSIRSHCISYLTIIIVCSIIYGNTLNASWHLDDFPNIVNNPLIHISDLSLNSLLNASNLFQNQNIKYSGTSYRPVAFLTFAVNWFADDGRVIGYHITNIAIHVFCAICLYLLLISLLNSPVLIDHFKDEKYDIALLSAILWAVHPIQTQAVTYIVQRMAELATLFYLLAMICYVQARMAREKRPRSVFYSGCVCCLLLAVGSKENAVFLPIALGLIEIIFFQNLSIPSNRKKVLKMSIVAVFGTVVLGLLFAFIIKLNPLTFFHRILENRSYTLAERLLTEPRIVTGYIFQIFYPVLNKFSIEHSVAISSSLLQPITTLPSLFMVIGLIAFSVFRIQKNPILSFAILFYFLNQLMESSILPLELVFEHRNYLPTLFIFFPVSAGIVHVTNNYRKTNRNVMFILCCSLSAFYIVMLGTTTYLRNGVWISEKTLWEDALAKASDSARPYGRLAYYYETIGQYDSALKYYDVSLKKRWSLLSVRSVTLSNMARIYILKHEYEKALALYEQSFLIAPDDLQPIFLKARLLIKMGRWDEAKQIVNMLLTQKHIPWDDFNLMGLILLKENDPERALDYFRRALDRHPGNPIVYNNIGISLSKMKYYHKAGWFMKQSYQMEKENIFPLLCLMGNYNMANNDDELSASFNELYNKFSLAQIENALLEIDQDHLSIPLSSQKLKNLIAAGIKLKSAGIIRKAAEK